MIDFSCYNIYTRKNIKFTPLIKDTKILLLQKGESIGQYCYSGSHLFAQKGNFLTIWKLKDNIFVQK